MAPLRRGWGVGLTLAFLSGETSGLPVDLGESDELLLGGLRRPNLGKHYVEILLLTETLHTYDHVVVILLCQKFKVCIKILSIRLEITI